MELFHKQIKVAKNGTIRIPPGLVIDIAGIKPKTKLSIEVALGKIVITPKVEVPKEQKEFKFSKKEEKGEQSKSETPSF